MKIEFKKSVIETPNIKRRITLVNFNDGTYLLHVKFHPYRLLVFIDKPIANFRAYPARLRWWWKSTIKDLKFAVKYKIMKAPVYYEAGSTDCDLVTRYWSGKCKNLKKFYKLERELYEDAEGPTFINIVDEKDFVKYNSSRDHIMEAYENGNGRKVIL